MPNQYQIAPVAPWSYDRPSEVQTMVDYAAEHNAAVGCEDIHWSDFGVAELRDNGSVVSVYRWITGYDPFTGVDVSTYVLARHFESGPAGMAPVYATAETYRDAMRIAMDAVASSFES